MEYLEKAKYELILGLQNEEKNEVIKVLQQYYNDMVKILTYNPIKNNEKCYPNYILNIHEDNNELKSFFFTCERKMYDLYDKIKDENENKIITFTKIENIDPENTYIPNKSRILNYLKN